MAVIYLFQYLGESGGVDLNKLLLLCQTYNSRNKEQSPYLKFVEVITELLKAFFECDETCRDLGGC